MSAQSKPESTRGGWRCARPGLAAVSLLSASTLQVDAGETRSQFSVSVTVLPVARMELRQAPATIQISTTDIARGYVDVRTPTVFEVRGNTERGYIVNLQPQNDLIAGLEVNGLGAQVAFSAEGGAIVQRWNSTSRQASHSITYRLRLSSSAQPGVYGWPVYLSVAPL